MSTPNPASVTDAKDKDKEKETSVGSKFSSFFHGLKSDKKESSSSEKDKDKDKSVKDQSAAKEKDAAATSQSKEAAGQKGESNKPSTKEKFFDFFKSDAEKKADKGKEKEKEKEKEASIAAPSALQRQTTAPDPIKLELRCVPAMPLAPLNPSVGDAIEAEGFILRSSGTVPFSFSSGNCRWFRASADGFDQIAQSKLPAFVATIDDVDCKICCQWQDDNDDHAKSSTSAQQPSIASQSSFGEIGPIHMNPAIAQASLDVFKGGKALFTVKESGTDELMTITVKKTMIRILPARGGEVRHSFMLLPKSGSANSIHSSASTSSSVKFLLDSIDPTRFSIEDVQTHKVFRGSIGLEGDQTLATASAQELNRVRRERDVMACLIRRIIKTGSELLPAEDKPIISVTTNEAVTSDLFSFLSNPSIADSITTAANIAQPATTSSSDADIVDVKIAPASSSESTDLIELNVSPATSITVTAPAAEKLPSAIAPLSIAPVSLQLSPIATVSTATTSAPPPNAGSGTSSSQLFPAHSPSQILSLSQRISELTAEKNLFKENINLILVEKQQAEAQAKLEIEALKRQLGQKDTELNELSTKLVRSGEDVDAMKLAINTLSEQMTHQANLEIKLSNEIRALKSDKETAAQELKKEKENHAKAMQGKDEAMSKLQAEFSAKSKEFMSLNSDYQSALSASQKVTSLEDKIGKLQENESNLKHDIGIYKSELVKMKEIQQKLDVVEMENYQLRKEKEKRKAEQSQQQQQLNTSSHSDGAVASEVSIVPPVVVPPDSTTSMTSDDALELALPSASARRGGAGAGSDSGSSTPTKQDLTPTTATHASNPSISSSSSIADSATITSLKQQVADLQSQCETLTQARDEAEQELESVQRELSTVQTSIKAQVDALAQLQSEHEDLKKSHEEVVANRNYFKRKCESLSSSVDKIIKEAHLQPSVSPLPSASPIPPAATTQSTSSLPVASAAPIGASDADTQKERKELKLRILELRNENAELNQTLAAYKKTLENNYTLLKHERDANLLLSKSAAGGSSSSGGLLSFGRSKGNSQLLQQFESVRDLANSLSETIAEKDQNLTHLRRTNLLLAKRVFDLEKRFEVELTEDARNGKTFNGKIDLEQEELKYQQQLQNQSSTDNSRRNSIGSTSESNPNSVPPSPSARNSASPAK